VLLGVFAHRAVGGEARCQPRQELLREQKLIRLHAVVRHQQPAAASLLQGMKVIARRGLCGLVKEGVTIPKHYYLQERNFGSFERSFSVPEGVDADKIEASFKKGVLTVTLPKKPEAQKPAKKIEVKAA
jgi:hypothetical protein